MSPRYGWLVLATLLLCGSAALQADDAERLDRHGDPLPEGAIARLGTLRLRQGRFHALSYSPDGSTLASANAGEPMRLWDVKTGRLLRTFGTGSPRQLCLAFAPDGHTLVSGGNETALRFWDVAGGKEVKSQECHDSGVSAIAFSDNGRTLVSASYDKTVRLWDVATGKQLFKLEGHTEAAGCVAFAGDTIISGGEDAIIRLWSASGKVVTELRGHTAEIRALAVSPDKSQLASASWDGSVRIWDLGEPKLLHKGAGHKSAATALAWLKDGKTVVSGGWDGTLLWWDVATGKLLRTSGVRGTGHVYVLAVAPDGRTLASAGATAAPQFWDTATGQELDLFPGHHGYIGQIAFTADGKTVVTHGRDRTLNCWEANSGRLLRHGAEPSSADAVSQPRLTALAPAGRLWAEISHEYDIRVGPWDGKLDLKLSNDPVDPDSRSARRPVTALAFAPDERRLAAGYADGNIGIWHIGTGKPLPECGRQRGNFVKGLAFSGDGRMLASLNASEPYCRLWEVASGKTRAGIKDVVGQSVILSADGRSLALWVPRARNRSAITVVDTATEKVRCEVLSRRPEEQLTEALFSPDGRFLAAGTSEGAILLWDAATGKLLHVLKGPPGGVLALAFSPDGRRMVSGNMDTTALVWEVPKPPPLVREPAPVLTDQDLDTLWADLLADEAPAAWQAIRKLAAAPKQTLPFLADKLQPKPIDPKRIDRLITDLDSKQFDVRQRATTELERLGPAAEVALQKALAGKPPLEVQQRAERLLAKLASLSLAPDALRIWRGMEVLEQIGTPETRPILEKIAQEASVAALAEEARATLARLK